MESKTCGECRKHNTDCFIAPQAKACIYFESKIVTNGDRIRQGGNLALKDLIFGNRCYYCAFKTENDCCSSPNSKDCPDGIEEWLNAPKESAGKDDE